MIKTFTKFKRITTLLAGISMAAIPAVGQADWSFVGLGTAEGSSNAVAINDSGQVVGWSEGYAFITGPNGIAFYPLTSTIPGRWWDFLIMIVIIVILGTLSLPVLMVLV